MHAKRLIDHTEHRACHLHVVATNPASVVAINRLSDALIRTATGDQSAFREVRTLTSAKLFGICLRVCGDRAAAEDVLQEVYLTVWQRASLWDAGRASPITWLATVARNRAIDWRRAQRHGPAPLDDAIGLIEPTPDPEAAALTRQEANHIQSCLDKLDARQADAIRTAFFHGLTYSELATRDGVPLSTMKSCVRRGLAQLKLHLDPSLAAR